MLRIVVGMGSCGVAAGAGRVKEALERAGAKPGITGCVGACYLEPIVDLYEGAELKRRLVGGTPLEFSRGDDVRRVTQIFNDRLGEAIRQYPEQYLWSHRRWRED